MKKLCVVTSSRADYGLLYPLIKRIQDEKSLSLQLVVTGSHLSNAYGFTINEIVADGFNISDKIEIIQENKNSMPQILSRTIALFEKCFERLNPDAVIILGDRFEIMGVASVCLLRQIPVAHISGGDLTFGAIDDSIRHAVTKMSGLHFTGNALMKKRVIQMGEQPETVFNTGELSIDNILNTPLLSLKELSENLKFDLKSENYALVTYHPVTTEKGSEIEQVSQLMDALDKIDYLKFIITKANMDSGGNEINVFIKKRILDSRRFLFIDSLGMKRYLSAISQSAMVIGNSSSGIIEAPYFKIPTINIGNRQEGRLQAESIINCAPKKENIVKSIQIAQSVEFKSKCQIVQSLYGDGHASEMMIKILLKFLSNGNWNIKKYFYDIEFEVLDE